MRGGMGKYSDQLSAFSGQLLKKVMTNYKFLTVKFHINQEMKKEVLNEFQQA